MYFLENFKNFKKFNEQYQINSDDPADVVAAKKSLNDIQNQLDEYKNNKSKIEQLYDKDLEKDKLKSELNKIIGEDDKNPFLSQWANIKRIKKSIKTAQERIEEKTIEKYDLNDKISIATEENKEKLKERLSKTEEDIKNLKEKISEYEKNLEDLQEQHEEYISDTENKIKKWIDKIK